MNLFYHLVGQRGEAVTALNCHGVVLDVHMYAYHHRLDDMMIKKQISKLRTEKNADPWALSDDM